MWIHLVALGLIDGAGGQAEQVNKGGGIPAYYLYDSEQEKRDKQAEIAKKQAKPKSKASDYLAKSKAGKQDDTKLSDALAVNFKPEKAPKVDAKASRFIADQLALAESKAAEQIAAAIEEEEIAMCLMLI